MTSSYSPDNWIGRSIGDGRLAPAKGYSQRYRLDERLGSGGMGDVFLATDTLLGKQVALKLLKDTFVANEELRKRFEREVALCVALKSDHIVEVSDYGVTPEGHPFYVMEYLRGESLGQLLRREKRLSVERTVSIITQVCEGLHKAHEGVTLWREGATAGERIKIVHRDLKPDNVFLVPTALKDLVKILDFGIAKIRNETVEHTQLTSMFIGTFHYASPEQLEVEKDLDGRADIYSLGVILYEMLSGTDPFGLGLNINNISGMSWASAHTFKKPIPLRSQPGCKQISPELEAVVMLCLHKAPDERFGSIDDLKRALEAAVGVSHPPSHLQTFKPRVSPPLTPIPSPSQPPIVLTDSQRLEHPLTAISPPSLSTPSNRHEILLNNASPPTKFPLLLIGAGIAIAVTVTGTAYAYLRWRPMEKPTGKFSLPSPSYWEDAPSDNFQQGISAPHQSTPKDSPPPDRGWEDTPSDDFQPSGN